MSSCQTCFVLIALSLCLPQAACAAGIVYDVFLLGGQSNMDGRGISKSAEWEGTPKGNFLNATNYAKYSGVQNGVKIYYYNEQAVNIRTTLMEKWLDLKPGYSQQTAIGADKYYFGPELSFGRAMADAMPGRNIALIKYSVGGTNLREDWNPTTPGPQYTNFKSTVQSALAALTAQGDSYVVRGMIWHQGESDVTMPDGTTLTPTATYESQLKNFIGSVREDLSLPDMPFVVGEVYNYANSPNLYARKNIRAAQLDTSLTYPDTGFASSAGLRVWDTTTHFDADSQIALGERFATSMQALVPEPAALGLLGLAAVALMRHRGRTM